LRLSRSDGGQGRGRPRRRRGSRGNRPLAAEATAAEEAKRLKALSKPTKTPPQGGHFAGLRTGGQRSDADKLANEIIASANGRLTGSN
jgi:hypothetical protein